MRFRKLRIMWSVFWGVACVLLCVLWVRSYWWRDVVHINHLAGRSADFETSRGAITTTVGEYRSFPRFLDIDVTHASGLNRTFEYALKRAVGTTQITSPYWTMLLLALVSAGAPLMIRWSTRFSVRTLLTLTTLVAVVLGAVIYATR